MMTHSLSFSLDAFKYALHHHVHISNGSINLRFPGVKHKSPMTVEDCYELAKIAYSEADYYHTELWMVQALKQLDGGEESTIDKVTVLDYLSYAIYQQGEIMRALEYTKRLLELGESSLGVGCITRWPTGAKHITTVSLLA